MSGGGRVRMPHNNRVHSSAALQMTGIWKNTIGYDPYAAENEEDKKPSETSYEHAKGIMTLARLSNKDNQARGACKKCNMMGHLTFQCRNMTSIEINKNNESKKRKRMDMKTEMDMESDSNSSACSSLNENEINEIIQENKKKKKEKNVLRKKLKKEKENKNKKQKQKQKKHDKSHKKHKKKSTKK